VNGSELAIVLVAVVIGAIAKAVTGMGLPLIAIPIASLFVDVDDAIVVGEIKQAGLYRQTAQAFAVLLPIQSVGVMGDARTYDDAVAVRSVDTEDFMTADWSQLPHDLLSRISTRIINEVSGVNRVVYDISSKPPATIEWE